MRLLLKPLHVLVLLPVLTISILTEQGTVLSANALWWDAARLAKLERLAVVGDLQRLGHGLEVLLEGDYCLLGFLRRQMHQQGGVALDVISCKEQRAIGRRGDLNDEVGVR